MKFRHGEMDHPTAMEHVDEIYREDLEEQVEPDIEVRVLSEIEMRAVDELLNEMHDPMFEEKIKEHEEMMREELADDMKPGN